MSISRKKTNGGSTATAKLVAAAAELDTHSLEEFLEVIHRLYIERTAPVLGADESLLLKKIENTCLSEKKLERLRFLQNQSALGDLSDSEYKEWVDLTKELEQNDAKRLRYLSKLAGLRQTTLRDLVKKMGLQAA